MRKLGIFLLLAVIAGSVGCANKKPLTREEALALRKQQIADTTYTYHNTDIDSVLVAANTVFQLADEDYEMQHSETGLIADRDWMLYLVLAAAMGHDVWYLETEQKAGDVVLRARLVRTASNIAGTPTGGGGAQATTLPSIESSVKDPSPYKLLFKRIAFFLKQEPTWYTCAKAKKELVPNAGVGAMEPLCFLANDDLPEGVVAEDSSHKKKSSRNGIPSYLD